MVLEIQVWSINYTLVPRICKNNANDKAKAVYITFKVNKTFESHSTKQNIFQQYYQSGARKNAPRKNAPWK